MSRFVSACSFALFIVLVHGIAGLVTIFADSLTEPEKSPLIYFLVFFPALVLGVFGWLVSKYPSNLYSPSDFRDENNYFRALNATASLAVASVKSDTKLSENDLSNVVETVQEAEAARSHASLTPYWRNHILWVDDRPVNNVNERRALEAMGVSITLARSTDEVLNELRHK